jgi:hypothetical protein
VALLLPTQNNIAAHTHCALKIVALLAGGVNDRYVNSLIYKETNAYSYRANLFSTTWVKQVDP